MAVAKIEKRARSLDRKIDNGPRRHVRQVHVTTVIVRLERRDCLDFGRCPDRADERLVRQCDPVAPVDAVLVDPDLSDLLRQRGVEDRGAPGTDEAAELGDEASRADRLRPARLHRLDIDGEAVALVGTLYRDRAALGIAVGEVQDRGWLITIRLDLTFTRIMDFAADYRARPDPAHRR